MVGDIVQLLSSSFDIPEVLLASRYQIDEIAKILGNDIPYADMHSFLESDEIKKLTKMLNRQEKAVCKKAQAIFRDSPSDPVGDMETYYNDMEGSLKTPRVVGFGTGYVKRAGYMEVNRKNKLALKKMEADNPYEYARVTKGNNFFYKHFPVNVASRFYGNPEIEKDFGTDSNMRWNPKCVSERPIAVSRNKKEYTFEDLLVVEGNEIKEVKIDGFFNFLKFVLENEGLNPKAKRKLISNVLTFIAGQLCPGKTTFSDMFKGIVESMEQYSSYNQMKWFKESDEYKNVLNLFVREKLELGDNKTNQAIEGPRKQLPNNL